MKKRIEALPKIELHCHLDGSLPVTYVESVLAQRGESMERAALLSKLRVNDDCKNLTEYLEKFDLPLQCMTTPQNVRRAAYETVLEAAGENVKYIELRFAPMLSVNEEMDCAAVIENVVEGLRQAQKESGVYASAITCAMRHHSGDTNLRMMRTAREFLGNGVCALDLAGDESAYPLKEFRPLFREAQKLDFPFTIHAGECGSPLNVEEAARLGARRMGHGIALRYSEGAQEACLRQRIGVEVCPVSNFHTKAVPDRKDYPLKAFLQKGLLASLNTDNRTVSNTSLTREFHFITEQLDIGEEYYETLTRNAVETAFADDAVKDVLYRCLQQS